MATETTTRTIIIKPGETVVLPEGARIVTVGKKGNIQATSDCASVNERLQNAENYECYVFGFGIDKDNNTGHPMNEEDSFIKSIYIGGQVFTWPDRGIKMQDMNNLTYRHSVINTKVPRSLLDVYNSHQENGFNKRTQWKLYVRMLPSVAATAEWYCTGTAFPRGLWLKPAPVDCAEQPNED